MTRLRLACIGVVIVGFLLPSLVVASLEVFLGSASPIQTAEEVFAALVASHSSARSVSLRTVTPFCTLAAFVVLASFSWPARRLWPVLACGGAATFLSIAFVHARLWLPGYTGGHVRSTAILSIASVPIYSFGFLALGVLFGLAIGWRGAPFLAHRSGV